ncbi:MAG: hypothetical protein V3V56_07830, partial [bacterium]
SNIIRQAVEEGVLAGAGSGESPDFSESLLEESAERELAAALKGQAGEVEAIMAPVRELTNGAGGALESAYAGVMGKVIALRPVVDKVFDEVLVMAEDKRLRRNRLALLGRVGALFAPVADFSKIQSRTTNNR